MNRNSFRVFRGHLLREVTAAWLVAGLLLQSATAVAPDWWSTRGVLAPGVAADDYAVANQGQLKNLAKQAALEMNAKLSGGAGPEINALITAWSTPTPQTDDYAAVNQGQLKNVAAPFYERLAVAQLSPLVVYPWSQGLAADDYALANTGQLKAVFALQMPPQTLAGGFITLPPALLAAALQVWNALPVKPVGSSADDFDGDGIANLQEYRMGSPLIDPADIDGDRIPDSIEAAHPGILSQTRFADAVEDYDQDGVMNFEEILLGLDLASATTSTRTDGLDDATVLAWSLLGGGPLVPGTDAVRACWEGIDADWIDFHASGNEHWLVRTDADNDQIPDGLAAFRTEFWGPAAIWRAAVDDCDGDAMPDVWEYRYAFDLRDWQDAYDDPDDDEVSNLDEFTHGTHPRLADTDGDGYADNLEIQAGSLPTVPDSTPAQLPLELYTTGGWSQSALPGTALPQPLSVQATRGGIPWPGVLVKFAAAEGQLEAPAVVTQADGRAQLSYTTAAHPTLWQLTLTASAGAVQTTFAVTVTDVDTDSDGWADRLEQQYGSSPTNVAATPATQNPAVVSQERRYDIDSLRADDSWVWGEGYYPSPSGSVRKFGVSHYWNYLGDTGWTADVQLTPPQSRPVRFYPLEQALLTEAPWQPVIRRATWQLSPLSVWNWNDPTTTGHLPLRSAPYHPAIPACNRFDYTETPLGLEQGATGWGVAWNRVRLSLPGQIGRAHV